MTERVWSVRDALDWTVGFLGDKGIDQPRLSAEWLLSAATGMSRIELYAYHERPLSQDERTALRDAVKRRAAGEPLQYVTGEMPFRHVVIRVERGVFIPRPETEVLVQVALDDLTARGIAEPVVADLCTGSGCIACSIAQELAPARVWAGDLSEHAVAVADANAERLGVGERVTVACGDLLDALPAELRGRLDAIVANPPYIPSADLPDLPEEVLGFEPHLALDGGPDGLDTARRIIAGGRDWLAPGGLLVMELDTNCVADALDEMRPWYEDVHSVKDLTGRDRIAAGRRP